MKTTAKIFTVINYVLLGILWLGGILTLLFNVLGLWAPWHLAGFGTLFYLPVPVIPFILSVVFSLVAKERKMIIANFISLGITFAALFVWLLSTTWFW
ncbi:MAG: hypothetical protein IJW70_04295 [Clostridia bacterium]|nr:hypothetical protein [Clostridia bacterium]